MNPLIERLEAWHRQHRPEYLAKLAAPISQADEAALRARVPGELPELFLELLHWHDGQSAGCYKGFQSNQMLMSAKQIISAMDILDEMLDGGDFEQEDWWRKGWVPFLDNGGGDHLCIDVEGRFDGRPGQILEFWHDFESRTIVYPTFEAWLQTFVEALEAGLLQEEGGGLQPIEEDAYQAFVAERNDGYPIEVEA